MARPKPVFAAAALVLVLVACGSSDPDPSRASGRGSSPTEAGGERRAGAGDANRNDEAPPENPAPEFSFETFAGETFRLVDYRGSPIVLNFWESW